MSLNVWYFRSVSSFTQTQKKQLGKLDCQFLIYINSSSDIHDRHLMIIHEPRKLSIIKNISIFQCIQWKTLRPYYKSSNTKLAVISRATLSNSMPNSVCAWNRMCKSVERKTGSNAKFDRTLRRAEFDRTANGCKQRKL